MILPAGAVEGIFQERLMCGRYYVDDETAREIEKLVRQADRALRQESIMALQMISAKEVCPTQMAPVLAGKGGAVHCSWQKWGFPGFQGKQVIFNARCETAGEKPLFGDSIRHSRIVVPAAWFYEWNRRKEKSTFYRKDAPVLFMAGCCRQYEDGAHFVILTTGANASVKPVHGRMPLILEQGEVAPWILNDRQAEGILHKVPCLLGRKSDYEQLCLF